MQYSSLLDNVWYVLSAETSCICTLHSEMIESIATVSGRAGHFARAGCRLPSGPLGASRCCCICFASNKRESELLRKSTPILSLAPNSALLTEHRQEGRLFLSLPTSTDNWIRNTSNKFSAGICLGKINGIVHSKSHTRDTMSSPGARSSPSRRRANGYHRHSQNEAQSAQLIEELSQLLLDDDRSFRRRLDEEAQAQQKRHVEALERALAHHDAIRRSAEHTYEAIQLQQERERLAREAEERRRVEEQRRRLEQEREAQRRREEEQRRRAEEEEKQRREQAERERQAAAEREAARKQQEEATRAREQQAAQEKAAREKEETEKKAREDAAAAQAQQQKQSQAASQATGPHSGGPLDISIGPAAVSTLSNAAPKALVSTIDDRMRVHEAYLRIHRRLKALRQEVDGLRNSNGPDQQKMYAQLREKKATITKTMGQLLKGESEQNKRNNIDKVSADF